MSLTTHAFYFQTIMIDTKFLTISLDEKKRKLERIRAELKEDFFGIDQCIDAIIDSIKTWYLLPQIITRPLIVNLWGLTGVGKTALIRRLVAKLGMTDKYVEIEMDGKNRRGADAVYTVAEVLKKSSVEQGEPGIILLDEMQRFRTVDDANHEVGVERFADVWTLLSDGKFAPDYSGLKTLIEYFLIREYHSDGNNSFDDIADLFGEPKQTTSKPRKFNMWLEEAKHLKAAAKLKEPLRDIMTWDEDRIAKVVAQIIESKEVSKELDYTKCLIFIAGNLDEAYWMSEDSEDADADADVFRRLTSKIGIIEIKEALKKRFKPEQIARFGNNHVIYPALGKEAYQKLIRRTCQTYAAGAEATSGIKFNITESVYNEIYDNSVYPAQGTRPVFTSIHSLFGSPLSEAILWALENDHTQVNVELNGKKSVMIFSTGGQTKEVPVVLDLRKIKNSRTEDFSALVAVHEAGHALVYALRTGFAPAEIVANAVSFKGGYVFHEASQFSKGELLERIEIAVGGIAAETLVFGDHNRSAGCEGDLTTATLIASRYIRRLGMSSHSSLIKVSPEGLFNEDITKTNESVERMVNSALTDVKFLLGDNKQFLIDLSKKLMEVKRMTPVEFVEFSKPYADIKLNDERDTSVAYAKMLKSQ